MDAAYEVASKAVLITPARFLFNAGFTPKAWNEKMLADEHLSVAHYEPDSNRLFPGLSDPIKAGIAVTYRDSERKLGPIGFFTGHPELNAILHKVQRVRDRLHRKPRDHERTLIRYTAKLYEDHDEALALRPEGNQALVNTNAFEMFSFLFHAEKPSDGNEYVQLLGVKGTSAARWIRSDTSPAPPASTGTRSRSRLRTGQARQLTSSASR